MTGQIKRLMDKGFGFIAPSDGSKDLFFHFSQLVDVDFQNLKEGDMVTFELEETQKGLQAVQVTLANVA